MDTTNSTPVGVEPTSNVNVVEAAVGVKPPSNANPVEALVANQSEQTQKTNTGKKE